MRIAAASLMEMVPEILTREQWSRKSLAQCIFRWLARAPEVIDNREILSRNLRCLMPNSPRISLVALFS